MNKIVLKPVFNDYESGYNGKFAKLEGRNDLDIFLINAYRAGRKDHVAMFDNPPSLAELLKADAEKKLEGNEVYTTQALHLPRGVQAKSMAPAFPDGGTSTTVDSTPVVSAGTKEAVPAKPAGPQTAAGAGA
jgi:hypothetical protein